MILYHAVTVYHVLKFAVHKLRFHQNENAILLYPSFFVRKLGGFEKDQNSIFNKCAAFEWERCPADLEAKEIFKRIEVELDTITDGLNLSDFYEINVCRAAYWFGSWLVYKNRPFQWFEEADGRLSQPEPIMRDDARIYPMRYELALRYGLYTGCNSCVTKKYVKMSSQLPDFYDPLTVDFDVVQEMNKLSQEQKTLLLDFFDVPRGLSFQPCSALMLTAHFCNLRVLTYEEHALCYQLTSDYYLEGYKLYYKVHPSDLMPYQSFMENVDIVPAHFPSELMTLVLDQPFEVGASVSSTGIYNISSLYKKVLIFNEEYIKTFWHNHRYYFCVKLMAEFPEYHVCAVGVNQKQMENMIAFGGVLGERQVEYYDSLCGVVPSNRLTLYLIGSRNEISGGELQSFFALRNSSDIIVFLNEDDRYIFYSIMKSAAFIVKELRLSAVGKEDFDNLESCERVVIFTEDFVAKRKVEDMKFVKRLIQTDAELSVFSTVDKDTQISALKGMLKATEQQLMQHIEENSDAIKVKKELEKQIELCKREIGQLTERLKLYEGEDEATAEAKREAAKLQAELRLYNMKLANEETRMEIDMIKAKLSAQESQISNIQESEEDK